MQRFTFYTLVAFLLLLTTQSYAQQPLNPAHRAADKLTREMATALALHEADVVQLYKFNRERFTKLATLKQQAAHLTQRQEDVKRSQLEQEYHERIFGILNARQYVQYKRFKENRREFTQPNQVMASRGK